MKKRKIHNIKSSFEILKINILLFVILTLAAFIRIKTDTGESDPKTTMFALALSVAVILGLIIYNAMAIRFFEDLNQKYRILNYCLPTAPLIILFITLNYYKISGSLDFAILLTLILISNALGFYLLIHQKAGRQVEKKK